MALTKEQQRSLSLIKIRRRRAEQENKTAAVLKAGERMANRNAPVGTLPPDLRIRRGFEDAGMPIAPAANAATGLGAAEANAALAAEQGVSPYASGQALGEVVQADFGPGFYDDAGGFQAVDPANHVVLTDPQSGRMVAMAKTPDMDESALMGLARQFLGGAAAAAPTRLASGAPAAAARAPGAAAATVGAFDRSGVDPSLVTALEARAPKVAAQMLRNTPAGGPIQRGIAGNMDQAANAAERIAGAFSDVGDAATAGARVRTGAGEFVSSIVPAKQDQLYDAARALIPETVRAPLTNTVRTLDEIEASIGSPAVKEFLADKNFTALAKTIEAGVSEGGLSFDTLRQLRTAVRALKPSQDTKVGINKTIINRIYDALTRDMNLLAQRAGGERAVTELKKADQFTYDMMGADNAPVRVLEKLVGDKSDERIFSTLMQWGGKTSGADVEKLATVKRTIPRDRWKDFVGTVVRNMGKPTPGAQQVADAAEWSPSTFMTSYEKLSPRAKNLMFADTPAMRSALDDLLTVAGKLKDVQKLANPSGSGTHMISAAMGGSLLYAPISTLSALGSGNVASRVLTNPKLARWLTGAYRTAANTARMPPARADMAWRGQLQSISAVASNDNEVATALTSFVQGLRQSARGEQPEEAPKPEGQP